MHNIIALFAVLISGLTAGYVAALLRQLSRYEEKFDLSTKQMSTAQETFKQVGADLITRLEAAEQKLTSHDFKLNSPLKKF